MKLYGYQLPLPFEILARKMVLGFSPQLVIVGDETGVGKSMLGARASEIILYRAFGKIWKPKDNLFFKMKDFKDELLKSSHRIFIIEEAEIELGSDEWQNIQNKYFNRMKSTQRIKGNLYIVILPIFMQLARKNRRSVNYLWDVKGRGYFKAYKIIKKASQVLGDELGKWFICNCTYQLPTCKKEYDISDKINKDKIEEEEGRKLEYQIALKEVKKDIIYYTYTCPYCDFVWKTKRTPKDKINKECPMCKKYIYWDKDHVKITRILS